jgi:cation diffusion facilitator CzcD-associated flavoprotein CzcO
MYSAEMTLPKISRVAVIGAGISGVSTAAHLLKLGVHVIVFERGDVAGGVWHYDENIAAEPAYPSVTPSKGDYERLLKKLSAESTNSEYSSFHIDIGHAPPGPCYAGLMNNVSTRLMKTTLLAWPQDIGDFVSQRYLEEYIQDISRTTGVHNITQYRTRVEDVQRVEDSWQVHTISLVKRGPKEQVFLQERHWIFDAVVAASGHYNAPRIPNIPGLAKWKATWPDRVQHSKGYRKPAKFKDKTVLLIGAGVSSNDIAREISPLAKKIYQSSRGGILDLPASLLPPEATRVVGIHSFTTPDIVSEIAGARGSISRSVHLTDGTTLEDIDHVIMCTGYMISYPYLPQYHSDTADASSVSNETLVTSEGQMVHNCYKDTFFIPEPTLAFVGTPYHIATFSLFEFQGMVIARVFAGLAELPSTVQMQEDYQQKLLLKGIGRDFHSLRGSGEEENFVTQLVGWMNRDARRLGHGALVLGHTPEWHAANKDREEKLTWLRAAKQGQIVKLT